MRLLLLGGTTITGAVAATLGRIAVAASASITVPATVAATLGKVSASASATVTNKATIAPTLGKVSCSAFGSILDPAVSNAVLSRVSASALASVGIPATVSPSLAKVSANVVASIEPSSLPYFEQNLLAYLNGKGIVCYPGHIPQGVSLPAYSFNLLSGDSYQTLRRAAGLAARTYQFSAFSTDALDTIAMEDSLRVALNGFTGFMGSFYVSSCRLQNPLDLPYEVNVDGSDDGTYQRVVEYRILFGESVPTF